MAKYREFLFQQEYSRVPRQSTRNISRKLGITLRKGKRLAQRLHKHCSLVPRKRGKKPTLTKQHMTFLKEWFLKQENIGKPFKIAYQALMQNKGFERPALKLWSC